MNGSTNSKPAPARKKQSAAFFQLPIELSVPAPVSTANDTTSIRLQLERADGARLTLTVPALDLDSVSKVLPNVNRPNNVVYGIIPQGFRQITPKDNITPPPLAEGRRYTYWAQGFYGGKVGCFEIREGKALKAECENREGTLEAELTEGGNPPSFTIKGDDYLYELLIYYVDSTDKDVGKCGREYVWQVRPENEYKKKLPVEIG